jgi:hypothetical protein
LQLNRPSLGGFPMTYAASICLSAICNAPKLRVVGDTGRRLGLIFLSLAVCCFLVCSGAVADQAFTPVRTKLLGPFTDRDLVDIEIVGSNSLLPNRHKLQPERVLRLRLERAFIGNFLTKDAPGFSILNLRIDRPTGLPTVLIDIVGLRGRFHQDIPGIPVLRPEERIGRNVSLTIQSDHSAGPFSEYSKGAAKCIREPSGDDLWEMKLDAVSWLGPCSRSIYPNARKWLGRLPDGSSLIITCQSQQNAPCSTKFIFERFSVEMNFHQSVLNQWKELIAFSQAFLKSKQVTP